MKMKLIDKEGGKYLRQTELYREYMSNIYLLGGEKMMVKTNGDRGGPLWKAASLRALVKTLKS